MVEGRAYRGCVEKVGTDVHSVRLVDFGTLHSVEHLFTLDNYYQTLPSLAVNCSLANITRLHEDPCWPEEAAEFLEENLKDCLVKVRIVSCQGDKPSVEIYTQPASGAQT